MSSNKPTQHFDNTFSTFIMGLSVGVLGAFLLGTKEGRSLVQEALNALPENWKPSSAKPHSVQPNPIPEPLSTPHHLVAKENPIPAHSSPKPFHTQPEFF